MIHLAEFADETALLSAMERLRRFGELETFTPRPVEALARRGSRLPVLIMIAGFGGALGMMALMIYATVSSYPIDVGGRPLDSWPAYVPIAFEVGVLCAVAAGVFGFLIANRMPALYAPFDRAEVFRTSSSVGFVLMLESPSDDAAAEIRALRPLRYEALP